MACAEEAALNPRLSLADIRTYSARDRVNLVTIGTLLTPGESDVPAWDAEGFDDLVRRILKARENRRPVIPLVFHL